MIELSLNILDIVKNSTKADAKNVEISIIVEQKTDSLTIIITDDGYGMDEQTLKKVTDPFVTTRKTRKVGMGIPLFKMSAEQTGGHFKIVSKQNKGTTVTAGFVLSSIDRVPLGDIGATITTLIAGDLQTDFTLNYSFNSKTYTFSTKEVKEALGEADLSDILTLNYLQEMINENILNLNGGIII